MEFASRHRQIGGPKGRLSALAGNIIETEADLERGIRALRRKCAIMRRVHDATGLPPLRRREPGFDGLARIIVGQQVSVASADAIWQRCEGAIRPFTPEAVAKLDDEALRSAGLSRPKVRTFRAIAEAATSSKLDFATMHLAADEEVYSALTSISGIGPWTADIFLIMCLGRRDAFAAGDLALQIAAQDAYELTSRPNIEELLELAEDWRPWRAVAARLLWSYYRLTKQKSSGAPI